MTQSLQRVYDGFTELLDLLAEFSPTEDTGLYADFASKADGAVVELGIGLGRVARTVQPTYGVDLSPVMLAHCRDRLGVVCPTLIQADFQDYTLPAPASFTYLPQCTINNLKQTERERAFRNILRNTAPGGRFVFDSVIPNVEDYIRRSKYGVLRGVNHTLVVYELLVIENYHAQEMSVRFYVDFLDSEGCVTGRKYYPVMPFHFVFPQEFEAMARATGWDVEALWGGHQKELFTGRNDYQVWVLRKP